MQFLHFLQRVGSLALPVSNHVHVFLVFGFGKGNHSRCQVPDQADERGLGGKRYVLR